MLQEIPAAFDSYWVNLAISLTILLSITGINLVSESGSKIFQLTGTIIKMLPIILLVFVGIGFLANPQVAADNFFWINYWSD